jgi:hypothetical protein
METGQNIIERQLSRLTDQFIFFDFPLSELFARLKKTAGGKRRLLRGFAKVFDDVPREWLGQILQLDKILPSFRKFDQTLGEGELVRGDVLPEQDDGSPVVFGRSLSFQKFCH